MSLPRRRVLAGSLLAAGARRLRPAAPGAQAPTFFATDITGAEFARRLELPDVDGKPRTLADFKGKVTVVFFGYTQCPDVCPTTMAELAAIKKSLGADGRQAAERVRDRRPGARHAGGPEGLRRQLRPELHRAARHAGADRRGGQGVQGVLREGAGRATAAATPWTTAPASFVFDPPGRVRLYVRYGGDSKKFAADLEQLVKAG